MKLNADCKSCNRLINYSLFISDRAELSKRKGDRISLQCKECFHKDYYHPNDIYATKGKIRLLIYLASLITVSVFVYFFLKTFFIDHREYIENTGFAVFSKLIILFLVPISIYSLLNSEEKKKVRDFNKYKVKE